MKKKGMMRTCCGWVFIGALISAGFSADARAQGDVESEEAIREVVDQFRRSGDLRDLKLAKSSLHEDFALYYHGPDGWVRTDRDGYKAALSAEVIGGETRTMSVERIEITGSVASAHVRFQSSGAEFDQFINLIETPNGWKIVGIVLNFIPKG